MGIYRNTDALVTYRCSEQLSGRTVATTAERPDLYLHEAILLLTLHDKKGTTGGNDSYRFALGGAILTELVLASKIRIVSWKRTNRVEPVDAVPLGEPLLDECLEKITQSKRPKSASSWVSRFASIRRLKHRVAERLCKRGLLEKQERKVFGLFNRWTYPAVDPEPERQLVELIRRVVIEHDVPDPRILVLVSLMNGADLLASILGKKVVKENRDWIKRLVEGDAVGKATKQALDAARAAVMVVTMTPR